MLRIYLWCILVYNGLCFDTHLGCFKDTPLLRFLSPQFHQNEEQCTEDCYNTYYRYAFVRNGEQCLCGNYMGEQVFNGTCSECTMCDITLNLTDIYATGNLVSGPPKNFQVYNVTSDSVSLSWSEPDSFVNIMEYKIKPIIVHTYSSYPIISPEWTHSNNTFQTELTNLYPGTKYNITLYTRSNAGTGAKVYKVIETEIKEPDELPPEPTFLENGKTTLKVKLNSVTNNNGPVTSYRVVLLNEDAKQDFDKDRLFSYDESKRKGLFYYIAAELQPKDIDKVFVVGDGKTYGGFYNPPLNPSNKYNVIQGVVSRLNGLTKSAYSDTGLARNGVMILNVGSDDPESASPAVIIGLSVAIGLLSFMLVVGIIGFLILKNRVIHRRQRLSDNQELSLQGPMIEVENNGYIHEEELPVNHYRSLKQKVRTIANNQLKIEPTNLLGIGKYGRVNSGTFNDNTTLRPVAVYNILDKKMSSESKKSMLRDLDALIKVGSHNNLISLMGTCETPQMVCVLLDYVSMNLKDLLLGSRDSLPGRFSNMLETQALDIAVGICTGLAHLEACQIIHRQVCARNIMITESFTPKVSGYGLAQYHSHNKIPDYTRWTALEVFKGQPHNPKSDVWAFGCLLWEVGTLGGTPYGNVSDTNEIPDRITRGLRLPQLQYVSDDFYQIMLDCWQQDCDERPKFCDLMDKLYNLRDNSLLPFLSFGLFPNFQYEQFYPDMELAVRPVF